MSVSPDKRWLQLWGSCDGPSETESGYELAKPHIFGKDNQGPITGLVKGRADPLEAIHRDVCKPLS